MNIIISEKIGGNGGGRPRTSRKQAPMSTKDRMAMPEDKAARIELLKSLSALVALKRLGKKPEPSLKAINFSAFEYRTCPICTLEFTGNSLFCSDECRDKAKALDVLRRRTRRENKHVSKKKTKGTTSYAHINAAIRIYCCASCKRPIEKGEKHARLNARKGDTAEDRHLHLSCYVENFGETRIKK